MIETPVILAALRRGWSLRMIAEAAGVSFQAIQIRIKRFEKRTGTVALKAKKKIKGHKSAAIPWSCKQCGKITLSTREARWFCSKQCEIKFRFGKQLLQKADIERAIDMRKNGTSWFLIAKAHNTTVQNIQTRIWYLLNKNGLLNRRVVDEIWCPVVSEYRRHHSVRWLERSTGFFLAEAGAPYPVKRTKSNRRKVIEMSNDHGGYILRQKYHG